MIGQILTSTCLWTMEILAPLFFCHLWSGLYLQKVKDINRVRAMMFHLTVTNYVCINWIFVCGLRHEDSRDIVHLLDGSGYRTKGPPSRQWSEFMVKVKLAGNQLVFCQTYFVFWREFVHRYQCFYWNPQTFFWWTLLFVYNLEEAESQFNSCCKQHMEKATKTLITMIQWPK